MTLLPRAAHFALLAVLDVALHARGRPVSSKELAARHNLPPRRLIEQLVGEYVFAELALAALESFASENAARLATMESARVNIEDKLDELFSQKN